MKTTGGVGRARYTYESPLSMRVANSLEGRQRAGSSRVLLVVEDDDDCRETISETLEDAGYDVVQLDDAEQALRFLHAGDARPHGIILDVWLPGMSGRELLGLLKQDPRLSWIPVLLTSAGRPGDAETVADAGWLPKPFDAERLLAAVSQQCSAVAAQDESIAPPTNDCGDG